MPEMRRRGLTTPVWVRLGPCCVHWRPDSCQWHWAVVAPLWFPFLEQLTHGHPQEEGGQTAGAKGTVGGLGCDGRGREGKTQHP